MKKKPETPCPCGIIDRLGNFIDSSDGDRPMSEIQKIELCPLHAAAPDLLKACKYAFDILMRMPEEYAEAISEQTLNGKAIDTAKLEIAITKAEARS